MKKRFFMGILAVSFLVGGFPLSGLCQSKKETYRVGAVLSITGFALIAGKGSPKKNSTSGGNFPLQKLQYLFKLFYVRCLEYLPKK